MGKTPRGAPPHDQREGHSVYFYIVHIVNKRVIGYENMLIAREETSHKTVHQMLWLVDKQPRMTGSRGLL